MAIDAVLSGVNSLGVPTLASATVAGFFVLGLFFAMISNRPKVE
jgi:hypothetical protein